MKAPKLRFKVFEDEYSNIKLSSLLIEDIKNGTQNKEGQNEFNIKFINVVNLYRLTINVDELTYIDKDIEKIKPYLVYEGDLFYTRSSLTAEGIAHCNIYTDEYFPITFDDHIMRVRVNEKIASPNFIKLYSLSSKARKYFMSVAKTGTMTTIGQSEINNLGIKLPSYEEQVKIAEFFSILDTKIQLQQEKIDLLKEQKKGYMQKVFKQEIRFKDKDGRDYKSWIYNPLSKIADKISKKNKDLVVTNVISNSASKGLISQIEYFEKGIANKENIGGYYVISTGDFVYNPRISSEAPYGPVNIYTNKADGIVSPLYTCFRFKESNKKFIYYYFKSSLWHKYVYTNGDSGARHDRVSIKDSTFFEMPIALPSLEEQEKIATFFSKLDGKIQLEQQKLEALHQQKKGFMQQMFI